MRKYLLVGAGGAAGALIRFAVIEMGNGSGFPYATLLVNIAGSFLLALILTEVFHALKRRPTLHTGITVGFLGALTTFSTLIKETVVLAETGHWATAIVYIAVSVTLGMAAAYLGLALGEKRKARQTAPSAVPEGEEAE